MVKAIEGIIAPLVTPFDEAGRLDAARAKGEIRRLLDAGVDGICLLYTSPSPRD